MVREYSTPIFFVSSYVSFSEFNHERVLSGECKLILGSKARPSDKSCPNDSKYWYERTAYRRIVLSKCEGGVSLDIGKKHSCRCWLLVMIERQMLGTRTFLHKILLVLAAMVILGISYHLSFRLKRRVWFYIGSNMTNNLKGIPSMTSSVVHTGEEGNNRDSEEMTLQVLSGLAK